MDVGAADAEQPAVEPDRREQQHVVDVLAAVERVVDDERLAVLERRELVLLGDRGGRGVDRVQQLRDVVGDRDGIAARIEDRRRDVADLAHDGRVRGAVEVDAHLLRGRREGVADHRQRHRVHAPASRMRLPSRSARADQPSGTYVVAVGSSITHGPGRRLPASISLSGMVALGAGRRAGAPARRGTDRAQRRGRGGDQPVPDHFHVLLADRMPVADPVRFVERLDRRRDRHPVARHADLVGLADVSHVHFPAARHLRPRTLVGLELPVRLGLEVGEQRRDVLVGDARRQHDARDREVLARIGQQQAVRGDEAGVDRHEHARDAEVGRHRHRVQRPGAAVRHDRVVARVVSALDGHKPDGLGHRDVDEAQHALERLEARQPHAVGQGAERRLGGRRVEPQPPAEERLGADAPDQDVRVRDGEARCRPCRTPPGPGPRPRSPGRP